MGKLRSIRRNIVKNDYAYLKDKENMSLIAQKAEVFRNGITAKDLKEEFQKGYGAGWEDGRERLYKTVLASICLVMDDRGVGSDEIIEFLHAVDNRVIISIDESEDIDEVFDRIGVELHFNRAMDRVERKDG